MLHAEVYYRKILQTLLSLHCGVSKQEACVDTLRRNESERKGFSLENDLIMFFYRGNMTETAS